MLLTYAHEADLRLDKTRWDANFEQMVFAADPERWNNIFGNEMERLERNTQSLEKTSLSELEELISMFQNPPETQTGPSTY